MLLHAQLASGVRKLFVLENIVGVRQNEKKPSTCYILDTNSIEFEVADSYEQVREDIGRIVAAERFDRFVLAALASVGDSGFDAEELAKHVVQVAEKTLMAIER